MKPVRRVTAQTLHLLRQHPCSCSLSDFLGPVTTHPSTENSRNSATQQSQRDHGDCHVPNKAAQTRLQGSCGDQCNQKFPKECEALSKNVLFQTKHIPVKSLSARSYHSVPLTEAQHADLITCTEDNLTVKCRNRDPDEKSEGEQLGPFLEVLTSSSEASLKTEKVIPGKGPPPEPPVECCMSGCAKCAWTIYAEELMDYYSDGGDAAREALEKIENPSLKVFLKLELGL